MNKKDLWKYMEGHLRVKVKARDENERFACFEFECVSNSSVSWYDRSCALEDVARAMCELRGWNFKDIVDVNEVKE